MKCRRRQQRRAAKSIFPLTRETYCPAHCGAFGNFQRWRSLMSCDTRLMQGQTLAQRKEEVSSVVKTLDKLLAAGQVRAKVGPQGAITFVGWADSEKKFVTDACAYRRIMATGSAAAKLKLAQAEQLAGRSISRQVVGAGVHS